MGQCEAMVDDENDSTCRHRCKKCSMKNDRLCGVHRRFMARGSRRLKGYVITKNYKPATLMVSNQGGAPRYRRYLVGKVFETKERAQLYMGMNWSLISKDRKNRRFVSACIEGAHRHGYN